MSYLAPILAELAKDGVNEVMINQPGEMIVETPQGKTFLRTDDTQASLLQLATLIASYNQQTVSAQQPLLSANLPDGERVQVVMPPAVAPGHFGLAIRKPSTEAFTLDDYVAQGAFAPMRRGGESEAVADKALLASLASQDYAGFLRAAVRARKTIVISGGTSSGKTTLCNALIQEIDRTERILTIEDAREVRLPHKDQLNLLFSKGGQGQATVSAQSLLEACLRLNPDRLFLSELRGEEAFYFLRAANTGHPGSLSTLHANSPLGAFDQLVLMIQQGGTRLTEDNIRRFIASVIDVVVQCVYDKRAGKRRVTAVYFRAQGHSHGGEIHEL